MKRRAQKGYLSDKQNEKKEKKKNTRVTRKK
jgi:hypothetical protein